MTHKLYWLSSKWVYIQFKYDIITWKNKLFFLKIDIIFILAFLILVYHRDENRKQRNFTQKHQTLLYKKCYSRFWVCFFFVVGEQDHKTPQKKNVIVFGFSSPKINSTHFLKENKNFSFYFFFQKIEKGFIKSFLFPNWSFFSAISGKKSVKMFFII